MGVFAKSGSPRSLRAAFGGAVVLGISALVLVGCSSGDADEGRSDRGGLTLKIGTILPRTGTLAPLGPPETAGVDLAVKEINDAKAGISIDVEQKDSGDATTDIATQSATVLLGNDVSAIIGAASSSVSKTFIDQVTQAGVIQISPANTSPDFRNYEDDGYYWRTAPSDVLQGRILGNKIVEDGKTNVSILYLNDAYGRGLEKNVKQAVEASGARVGAEETFEPASTDFDSAVTSVLATDPDALVVISFDEITKIAERLTERGFDFSKLYGVDGNYGIITENDKGVDLAGAQFTVPGVSASIDFQDKLQALVTKQGNAKLDVFSYAAESYDAVNVLALAALRGGSSDSAMIRNNLQSVSEEGTTCESFAGCAKLLKNGDDIDYEGVSGPIAFDKNGDPSAAYVSIYEYDAGNTRSFEQQIFGTLD